MQRHEPVGRRLKIPDCRRLASSFETPSCVGAILSKGSRLAPWSNDTVAAFVVQRKIKDRVGCGHSALRRALRSLRVQVDEQTALQGSKPSFVGLQSLE